MDGAFGLVLNSNKTKLLLVKRRDYPVWVMPGGRVEKGEIPEKTVIREIFEESGFRVKIVRKIAEYMHGTTKTSHFKRIKPCGFF